MDDQEKIRELHQKLEVLLKKQDQFQVEINQLRTEIYQLRPGKDIPKKPSTFQQDELLEEKPIVRDILEKVRQEELQETPKTHTSPQPKARSGPPRRKPGIFSNFTKNLDFEKFIGENLINKIGILILIIGVGIGGRYAIENDLISPLTRIILGYVVGFGLLATAFRLKKDYNNYSAVLLSGAMAILYFITFLAYSFYGLIPQLVAFGLMVLFTIFTVVAALNYDRQVIAIIGLVGAYGVPFLLSSGSGDVVTLFTYMSIINIGILVIAFRKYWKPLYYIAFIITWLIFSAWLIDNYDQDIHFNIAFGFAFVFFLIFYLTFLGYKLLRKEALNRGDVALLISNSFIFYGLGFGFLSDYPEMDNYLGLYTLFNALIHFAICTVIYKTQLANRNLFYLVAGMVLVFLTIAIPVQLDGNWVTLLWIAEAALLFWIGRTKNVASFEKWSYVLMLIAFGSLLHDWGEHYEGYIYQMTEDHYTPFLRNIQFASSLLFAIGLGFIVYLQSKSPEMVTKEGRFRKIFSGIDRFVSVALILVLFFAFYLEIKEYWEQAYQLSAITNENSGKVFDYNLLNLQNVWLVNYTMAFLGLMSFCYHRWFKQLNLNLLINGLCLLGVGLFLTVGLFELSELRDSYLDRAGEVNFLRTSFQVHFRYLSYFLCAGLLYAIYRGTKGQYPIFIWDLLLAGTVLWVGSAELIHIGALITSSSNYKIGLSIFWGVYALLLVILGIWKNKKHLRIAAMVLFGFTLLKLFAYDLSHMTTIAKTVVLVSLGVLLLIISFIYNKYQIGNEEQS